MPPGRASTFESEARGGTISPHALLIELLSEPESHARRRHLAGELGRAAIPASATVPIVVERRTEAWRRLSTEPDETTRARAAAWQPAIDVAERIVTATEGALREKTRPAEGMSRDEGGWETVLVRSLARDAGEGWPAALRPRFVFDLFGNGELTSGIRPVLREPGATLGAASFCRALGELGAALARADLPRDVPYCLARHPDDRLPHARAALFASIPAEPSFSERALGLGRPSARDQARRISVALALSLRVEALRLLVSAALARDLGSARDACEHTSARVLGDPLPPSLVGLLPRLDASPSRFLGIVEGVASRASFRDRFEDDWYRNPRAHEALRDEHHRTAQARAGLEPQPGAGALPWDLRDASVDPAITDRATRERLRASDEAAGKALEANAKAVERELESALSSV